MAVVLHLCVCSWQEPRTFHNYYLVLPVLNVCSTSGDVVSSWSQKSNWLRFSDALTWNGQEFCYYNTHTPNLFVRVNEGPLHFRNRCWSSSKVWNARVCELAIDIAFPLCFFSSFWFTRWWSGNWEAQSNSRSPPCSALSLWGGLKMRACVDRCAFSPHNQRTG